jgi:DNA (cytosine-5)-methyltransferase 1
LSYQKVTDPLMANSHPGSYCGQDAYSDMLVTDNGLLHRKRTSASEHSRHSRSVELYARSTGNSEKWGGEEKMSEKTVVRRLTELECERLQGFPDSWTAIGEWDETTHERYYIDQHGKRKKVTSSARYKALGNSIALPFWRYLARRIMAQYEKKDVTMGSLFDGISGFPLVFKECGCEPRWSSEIECFPIAVCKQHFGDEETGQEGDLWKYLNQ